jgi:hypothetical protein
MAVGTSRYNRPDLGPVAVWSSREAGQSFKGEESCQETTPTIGMSPWGVPWPRFPRPMVERRFSIIDFRPTAVRGCTCASSSEPL